MSVFSAQFQMHFYYAVGYGLPAIIVGLAVGLRPDAYGHEFCWLSIGEKIIWSFAGPICIVVCLNFVVFVVAFRYSCQHPKVFGSLAEEGSVCCSFFFLAIKYRCYFFVGNRKGLARGSGCIVQSFQL